MALFRVSNERAQFDAAGNEASDQYGAGIRFTQGGNARVTTATPTNYNQGIPMSATGQVAIVDATAGLPAGTIFHNGLPISGDKVCVSRNATAVVSNGTPYDAAGAVAGDVNLDLNFIGTDTLNSSVTFTRASTGTFFNSAGVLTSANSNIPRFDYNPATLAAQGLLIEEQRTNSIRNNTMQGAVAGTPGTEPTNWAISTSGIGLTREIVGVGTENGIAYIDIRFSGTPSSGNNVQIAFEGLNTVSATSGQTWVNSSYVKLQAGSFNNTTTTLNLLATNGTSGTESFNSTAITSTPADLRNCRLTVGGTLAAALGTTHVQPRVRIGYTVGVAFDITLRIGLPQLELGAFATSVIPTTTTALTRSADVASVNTLSPWYRADEGTLFAEYAPYAVAPAAAAQYVAMFSDGTVNNSIDVYKRANADVSTRFAVGVGAPANQVFLNAGTFTAATNKIAAAYKANDFAVSLNGGASLTDTAGTVPVVNNLLLGSYVLSNAYLGGYIRRITYYPRRLSNAELQAITA